jgi:putative PIN family toxin of toxin-antitoxin system
VIVVLDTNVLVAALVAEGLCREVVHRAVRLRIVASSPPLLAELEAVLRRKFAITPAVEAFLTAIRQQTRLVEPRPLERPVCRDRDDDVVVATAVAAAADFIVTGDHDLLVLGTYERVAILPPREFLHRLDFAPPPARRS